MSIVLYNTCANEFTLVWVSNRHFNTNLIILLSHVVSESLITKRTTTTTNPRLRFSVVHNVHNRNVWLMSMTQIDAVVVVVIVIMIMIVSLDRPVLTLAPVVTLSLLLLLFTLRATA